MNDQLQVALATAINKAGEGIEAGVTFLKAEIPEVITQLLMWKAVTSALQMLLSICIFAALFWMLNKVRRWVKSMKEDGDDWTDHPEMLLAAIPAVALGLLGAGAFSLTWLQILIAPKLYLIEYAARLAR